VVRLVVDCGFHLRKQRRILSSLVVLESVRVFVDWMMPLLKCLVRRYATAPPSLHQLETENARILRVIHNKIKERVSLQSQV
jgi:hypothetical protein